MKAKTPVILLLIPLLLVGCASIVDGGSKTIQINSKPEGAKVTISDKEGKEISTQTTPAIVPLRRAHGYFSSEDYKFVFEHAGYYPYEMHVKSTIDGWYFGNVLFGGLLGILIIDPATGAMYTLSPRDVNCTLISSAVTLTPEELKAAELKANFVPPKASPSPKSRK